MLKSFTPPAIYKNTNQFPLQFLVIVITHYCYNFTFIFNFQVIFYKHAPHQNTFHAFKISLIINKTLNEIKFKEQYSKCENNNKLVAAYFIQMK